MKASRFAIGTALAVGTVTLVLNTAGAAPSVRLSRARHVERTTAIAAQHGVRNPAVGATTPDAPAPAPACYRRYRLVDFGTFGGTNSEVFGVSNQINNRGEAIAQLETTTPDPYPICVAGDECLVAHGAVRELSGAIRDLGSLAPASASVPVWINDDGLITGLSQNGTVDPAFDFPVWRAVLWNKQRNLVDLGTLGGMNSAAYCVNSRGQVVGASSNTVAEDPDLASFIAVDFPSATQTRAFLSQNGSIRDLGTLGGNDATAVSVNEHGQVVGFSYTNNAPNPNTGVPTMHPFVWQNGRMRDLGTLGGTLAMPGSIGLFGGTNVLNESGDIAGTSMLAGDQNWHAFFWSNGRMTDIGTLGGSKSDAIALNNKGQVVGRSVVTDSPFVRHAFLWEKGRITDLGAVSPCQRSTATGINSAGQIVGSLGYCTDNPDDLNFFSAFYTEKGQPMVDLNTLITPPSPIHLEDAWNINERGEILANGHMPDGTERAVVLVPISGR